MRKEEKGKEEDNNQDEEEAFPDALGPKGVYMLW